MLINIVWIIVLQLDFTACFNFPCELHRPSPFSISSSCAGGWSGMVILLASGSVPYAPILAFHAVIICPTIDPYFDAVGQPGVMPRGNRETRSCLHGRNTRGLHS